MKTIITTLFYPQKKQVEDWVLYMGTQCEGWYVCTLYRHKQIEIKCLGKKNYTGINNVLNKQKLGQYIENSYKYNSY